MSKLLFKLKKFSPRLVSLTAVRKSFPSDMHTMWCNPSSSISAFLYSDVCCVCICPISQNKKLLPALALNCLMMSLLMIMIIMCRGAEATAAAVKLFQLRTFQCSHRLLWLWVCVCLWREMKWLFLAGLLPALIDMFRESEWMNVSDLKHNISDSP